MTTAEKHARAKWLAAEKRRELSGHGGVRGTDYEGWPEVRQQQASGFVAVVNGRADSRMNWKTFSTAYLDVLRQRLEMGQRVRIDVTLYNE